MTPRRRAGFTLIELLTVIAIIGILSAALFPAISGVRKRARQSAATTAFSQWAGGITRFKQVYGFYPNIGATYDPSKGDVLHKLEEPAINLNFVKSLSGRSPTGTPIITADRKLLNRNGEEFCAFGKDDFNDRDILTDNSLLVDRFGNYNIRLIFDLDNNTNIKNISGAPGAPESMPEDIRNITGNIGIPARIIIYTTDLLNDFPAPNGESSSDYAQVFVIQ
jgi:prepilin-type N-terminal cleavage/methylation domain-containing protein